MLKKSSRAILCPSCRKLVSANASVCIHCGRKNPGLWGYGPLIQSIFGGSQALSPILVVSCIILYCISLLIDPSALFQPAGIFNIFSPSMRALDRLGMTGRYALEQGRWWTLIPAVYLHGGILHILFNMLWIRQLGPVIEETFGTARAFIIFTLSGIGGYLVSSLLGVDFTIGASGAIFGFLGALIYYGRKRGGVFGTAVYRQVGTWAVTCFLFSFFMPGVNNFAHAGGFVSGYLVAQWLGFTEYHRETQTHHIMALITLGLTLACFLLALFRY
jgi:rhomboid protease GluP